MFKNTAAVILAAGKGTRMRSERPKVLHEVLGQPLVHFPVQLAAELDVGVTVIVVGHAKEAVEQSVRRIAPNVRFSHQVQQRGTGDAVNAAREATEGFDRLLILSGDVPGLSAATVERLHQACSDRNAPLAVLTFTPDDPAGYGRVLTDSSGAALRIVEHKDASPEERAVRVVNSGVYLVNRALVYDALSRVGTDNSQGEIYLTDIVALAHEAGTPGVAVNCDDHFEVAGVNDRSQLAQITARLQHDHNHALMTSGVTMHDPSRTWVELGVQLGQDVTLHTGVALRGDTTVGPGVTISAGVDATDTRIDAGAMILPYCVLNQAHVGPNAKVGPFAHLRPGTVLGPETKIGNFVETKKTTLGKGSKASHLTYLGDCDVGEAANIGAGTITCNYDGVGKHKTVISDRAFIGSNTELVAPVVVGEESVVGAGTTVTRDVPAGALAVSRADQKNIENWAYKHGPVVRKTRTQKTPGE